MIVPRSDIRREGTKRVERSLVAPVQLIAHVLGNLVKRDVSGAFVHDLVPTRNR